MVDPRDGFFAVDTEHQWSILFLTYHHQIVLRMTPLYLNMEVSEGDSNEYQQHVFMEK